MYAHRIEAIIDQSGQLHLQHLPFQQGEQVEVIILSRSQTTKLNDSTELPNYQIEAVNLGAKRQDLDNIAEILDELDAENRNTP